jgi:hypothetical protein
MEHITKDYIGIFLDIMIIYKDNEFNHLRKIYITNTYAIKVQHGSN